MYCLETLILVGNPVCNSHPEIARIEGNDSALQAALSQYFSGNSSKLLFGGETGGSFKLSSAPVASSSFNSSL